MKLKFCISVILFAIAIIFSFPVNVSAMTTGFETEAIPFEKAKKIYDKIYLRYESEEFPCHSIKCFDVSNSGLIAIGIDEDTEKHINVYDNNGTFQYGYSFESQGTYGIEFDDNNLIIYFVRGNDACLIDSEGNFIEMCVITNTAENNSYWQHNVYAKSKSIGNSKYVLSKPIMFSPSYTKLTKISSDGAEFVIIDVSTEFFVFVIIVVIIALIIVVISILCMLNYFKAN